MGAPMKDELSHTSISQDELQEARGAYELEPTSFSKFWTHKSDIPSNKISMKVKGEMGGLEFVHFLYTQTIGVHSTKIVKKYFSGKGLQQLPGRKPDKKATAIQVKQYSDAVQALERFGQLLTGVDPRAWLRSGPQMIIDDECFLVALAEQFSPGALKLDR
ncbi:hypothetical protein DUNSADRAFT_11307, partial [Dunaliella salina]